VLKKDTTIIEPTSGNTGIALAFVAAAKGYKHVLTMPETMSLERRTLLAMLGAKLVLTPGTEGMKGAIARAEQLAKETPNSWIPSSSRIPPTPRFTRPPTAVEIWEDTDGKVDILVSAVGTGAPSPAAMRSSSPSARPSPPSRWNRRIRSHFANARRPAGEPGPHKIQGTGAGFVPRTFT